MSKSEEELEGALFEAFRHEEHESVLAAIARLYGAGAHVLLREPKAERSRVVVNRPDAPVADNSRFQVLGEIARGGVGIVYRGRDKDLNRDVALKVLRDEHKDNDDVVQRFIEEAQVGGQLQHPGIAPVYALTLQPDGRPSFAMKLIKGETLAALLEYNPEQIDLLAVFEQVAEAVAYAHSRGVIHRDLKPANVMVGAFGEVQVVDWGFAKVLGTDSEQVAAADDHPGQTIVATVRSHAEGSQSIAGSVMGTPGYMPPEQALGHVAIMDERADVFALGAILCEILTDQPPYTGSKQDQLIAASQCRLDKALLRLDSCNATEGLKQLVRDCLQADRQDRLDNAATLATRLADHSAQIESSAQQAELEAVQARADRRESATQPRRDHQITFSDIDVIG